MAKLIEVGPALSNCPKIVLYSIVALVRAKSIQEGQRQYWFVIMKK